MSDVALLQASNVTDPWALARADSRLNHRAQRHNAASGAMRVICFSASLMALVIVAAGCRSSTGPCVDGYAGCGPVTTPSREHALAAEREPRLARRPFAEDVVAPRDGSVSHGPLFFEDAPGDTVGDDGCFAWSGDDFLIGSLTGIRFLANLALFPVSAIDTPPWRLMDSDGRPSRQVIGVWHDAAKRCDAPSAPCQPQPCNAG